MDLREKNLLSWQNILGSRQIVAAIEEKSANQGEVLHTCGGISRIHLSYQGNGNHPTELSTVDHVISKRH